MLKKIASLPNLSILLIFAVWLSLVISNFVSGTWLTGWDNLHPEFNFPLNIERAFNGVWQENFGVGLLGGMGHAADLPRQLILWFSSLFMSAGTLRYFWVFAMLLLGPLGAMFLTRFLVKNDKKNAAGLVSGLFYMCNLATLQYLYTPFDTFISFYGFLPWLLFIALYYLSKPTRKKLIAFILLSVLAAPSFLVQTLFFVYVLVLGVFVVEFVVRSGRKGWASVYKLGTAILAANSFWLLPVIYFVFKNAKAVSLAKINSIGSPETALFNQGSGILKNIIQLKGFWFDYTDLGEGSKFDYLFGEWSGHVASPTFVIITAIFALSAFLGLFSFLRSKNSVWKASPLVLGVISFVMLANDNPPFGFLYNFAVKFLPFFEEAMRSPFTKWSGVLALLLGIGLSVFVSELVGFFQNTKLRLLKFPVIALVAAAIVFTFKPAFSGKLISSNMRLEIPPSYFELFDYLSTKDKNARIGRFPVHTFWGWDFYDWGYRGSGFLWYGIKQPILDRAFDVWSAHNENYYHEVSTALYGEDMEAFSKVLAKYGVSYALIDSNVIAPEGNNEDLRITKLNDYFGQNAEVVFESGGLRLYKVGEDREALFVPSEYQEVTTDANYLRRDSFNFSSDYIESKSGSFYPFSFLFGVKPLAISFVKEMAFLNQSVFKVALSFLSNGETLTVSEPNTKTLQFPAQITLSEDNLEIILDSPLVVKDANDQETKVYEPILIRLEPDTTDTDLYMSLGDQTFPILSGETVDRVVGLQIGEPLNIKLYGDEQALDLKEEFLGFPVSKCWQKEGAEGILEVERKEDFLAITTKDAVGCMSFDLGESSVDRFVTVELPYRSDSLARPHFCILEEGEFVNCENKEVFYSSFASTEWTSVKRDTVLTANKRYFLAVAARPKDDKGSVWTIEYKPPIVKELSQVNNFPIDSGLWAGYSEKTIELEKGQYQLALYANEELLDFAKDLRPPENCDLFKRGEVGKESGVDGVLYRALGRATVCDYVLAADMATDREYLLRLSGTNFSGRSIKFYLQNNASKRSDLDGLLENGEFDNTYSILSWPKLPVGDYTLNVETRSFGYLSENLLRSVSYYSFPTEFVTGINLTSNGLEDSKTSNLVLSNTKKVNNGYLTDIVAGSGLVVLPQGYEDGWVGYLVAKDAKFARLLPFLFGTKLAHVKVNSWSNGFIIPDNPEGGEVQLVVFYWPQYLEYFGFGILLATLLVLVVKRKQKNY